MTVPGGQTSGVVCLLLAFIAVAMCVSVVTCLYQQVVQEQLLLDVTYEEVDTLQSQTIRLERNVPVKQSQKIKSVAHGPVNEITIEDI